VLLLSGMNPATFGATAVFPDATVLIYGVIVLALGQGPCFQTVLISVGPGGPVSVGGVRRWGSAHLKIVSKTAHFAILLGYLMTGGTANAFSFRTPSAPPADPHFIPWRKSLREILRPGAVGLVWSSRRILAPRCGCGGSVEPIGFSRETDSLPPQGERT